MKQRHFERAHQRDEKSVGVMLRFLRLLKQPFEMTYIIFAGMTLLVFTSIAHADDDLVRSVSVVGEAKESLTPDRATISSTVQAKNQNLDAAKKEHDAKLRSLLALAKKYDVDDKDQRTVSSRIHPEWRWEKNTQVFKGYTVSTTVSFTLEDIKDVGAFLEDVVRTKPHQMNGPNYHMDDTKPIRDKVRVSAMKDAYAKAEALAKQADLKVGKAISISDRYQSPRPAIVNRGMIRADSVSFSAMESAPVTPPAGEQAIHAHVYVTYELEE